MSGSMKRVADEVKKLADRLQAEGVALQVSDDSESGVIKIYGEGSDALKRALSGLRDLSELAYTTAEHHPYWGLVYHAGEISRLLLEKWDDDLSSDELSEIEWRIEELRGVLERLKQMSGSGA